MISGAELEFGGGLGVAIFSRDYVCACVFVWENLFAGRMMREVQGSQAVSSMVSVASE